MEYLALWLIGSFILWLLLLLALVITARIADFSLPPVGAFLGKAAIVAAGVTGAAIGLDAVSGFLSWIVAVALFFGLLIKLFDMDLWGAVAVVIATWVLSRLALMGLIAAGL